VEFPLDQDRGPTALLALFHVARESLCERVVGEVLDRDFKMYVLGQGNQSVVDGLNFALGELANASVGGILFGDVRMGFTSVIIWNP
jgi:hypothetical protein